MPPRLQCLNDCRVQLNFENEFNAIINKQLIKLETRLLKLL